MPKKLTLNVDETIIEKAKTYAHQTGRSLSSLVENYLRDLVAREQPNSLIDEKISRLSGKIKLPEDFNEAEALRSFLEEKHLK
ncbi:DUF6364 family protein [Cecembia lonarensis]|uniref:Uncharacterized protein n=1 Tax=Cecembia lonarensis (strain CCUG 58316 / KCTC 22772 / LW9) TaxID=1225176 RepID=K1L3G3_CECL9|nr:DUF6364 family protein [Cecembia lonarensis]EKB50985.1 hypothetical protein B879_00272 [Cecembia lonarensis LW9]